MLSFYLYYSLDSPSLYLSSRKFWNWVDIIRFSSSDSLCLLKHLHFLQIIILGILKLLSKPQPNSNTIQSTFTAVGFDIIMTWKLQMGSRFCGRLRCNRNTYLRLRGCLTKPALFNPFCQGIGGGIKAQFVFFSSLSSR